MAKQKKYPKQPKKSAPLSSWENYREKCKAVDQHNTKLKADKTKKESVIKSVLTLKSKRK